MPSNIAVLRAKISFIKLQSWEYVYISVKKNSFVIKLISQEEAVEITQKLILQQESKDGKVYTTPNFKRYLNKRKRLKNKILKKLNEF